MRRRIGFDQAVGAMYRAASEPLFWPEALTLAADHLGAIGGMVTRHGYRPHEAWMVVGRLDPELDRLYMQRHLDNGYARRLQWLPAGAPTLGSDVWNPAEARRSALHAEILAPQRIADLSIVTYGPWQNGGGGGGFAFCLSDRAAASPHEAVRRLARLGPHLRQALDLALALSEARTAERGLMLALGAMPNAVLLLDAAGLVLHANRAAESMLRAGDGLVVRREPGGGPGKLSAARPAEARALAHLVASAVGQGLGGRLRVPRPSGGPDWPLLVVPMPPEGTPGFGGRGRSAVAVLVGGPGATPEAGALRDAFGLTPAEARVLRAIAGGAGVPGVAAALGVSQETVRTHLNRCFDAAGVRNQAALAALVASLPRTGDDPLAAAP